MKRKLHFNQRVVVLVVLFLLLPRLQFGQALDISEKGRAAVGKEAMVTTAHPLASKAAIEILQKGGNAVDGAVAAAFVLGVVEADASGLGGGGGMVIYLPPQKKTVYINYYPKASERIREIKYTPRVDNQTAKAVLVPGTVAGLLTALQQFGKLPRETVMAPAIRYAKEGFPIDETLSTIILDNVVLLQKYASTSSIFLRDGFPLVEGDTLRQPELAKTLQLIAQEGSSAFYEGSIAERMIEDVTKNGGMLTADDLRNFRAEMREPVRGTYRGYNVLTADAPQSGVCIVQALNMLENEDLKRLGHYAQSAEAVHLIAETMRRVYADRLAYLSDPHLHYVPMKGLASKEYARVRFSEINRTIADPPEYRKTKAGDPLPFDQPSVRPEQQGKTDSLKKRMGRDRQQPESFLLPDRPAIRSGYLRPGGAESGGLEREDLPAGEGGGHTTHLSVIDKGGNVVSLTQTLGTFFGSGLISAGVLLNNMMSNFSTTTSDNLVEPNKQPRSSIAPTILMKDGKTFMTVGSPGAARIPNTIVQLILNVIDYGMGADEANNAPRFFCQKNDDYLHLEARIDETVQDGLRKKGHQLRVYEDYDLFFGGAQLILVDQKAGLIFGSADPRRGGVAIGF